MRDLVKAAGGTYSGDLVAGRTDILVKAAAIDSRHSQKVSKACAWEIPVVSWSWLADSQAARKRQDVQAHSCQTAGNPQFTRNPQVHSVGCMDNPSAVNKPRQALRDTTNVQQLAVQKGTGSSKTSHSLCQVQQCEALPSDACNTDSRSRHSFELPEVELPRRAITTRQDRSWRTSLASISSAEDPLTRLSDSTPQPLQIPLRPPSPSVTSASTSAEEHASDRESPSSGFHLDDLPDNFQLTAQPCSNHH